MQTKLIITCITDDVEFEKVEIPCQHPISKQDWELIKKALPIVLAKSEAQLIKDLEEAQEEPLTSEPSTEMKMNADFEVVKGA